MASLLAPIRRYFSPESNSRPGKDDSQDANGRSATGGSHVPPGADGPHEAGLSGTGHQHPADVGPAEVIDMTDDLNAHKPKTARVEPTLPSGTSFGRHRSSSEGLHRMRSISKVFNVLPANLPRARDIWRDVLEFVCHVLLLETDVHRHSQYLQDFEYVASKEQLHTCGRLFTRVKLASLASGITCLRLEDDEEDTKDAPHPVRSSLDVTPEEWKRMEEEWVLMKSYLLRADANAVVAEEDQNVQVEEKDDSSSVEDHAMFQEDYREVGRLLHYQHVITVWKNELKELLNVEGTVKDHRVMLVNSIDALTNSWGRLGVWSEGANNSTVPEEIEIILQQLRPCLASSDVQMVEPITAAVEQCNDLLLRNDTTDLSHTHLQSAMRSVLVKWSESVLDTPVLFQLGYGGVSAPVPEADQEDDVSSWGGDGKEGKHRKGARTRKSSRSGPDVPRVVNPDADEEGIRNDDDDDLSVVRERQRKEDPVEQRQRRAQFVAQKRVLLSPRTSMSSAVSNVDDPRNTRRGAIDDLPAAPMALLQMPLMSDGEKLQTKGKGPEPVNRDVFSQKDTQLPEATQNSNNTEWSETQDPDDVAMLGTQPESPMEGARSLKGTGRVNIANRAKKRSSLRGKRNGKVKKARGENHLPSQRKRSLPGTEEDTSLKALPRRQKKPKKLPFSQDEIDAIKEGVKHFGVGNWHKIKSSDDRLRDRDDIQIKNQYRSMLRCNQL